MNNMNDPQKIGQGTYGCVYYPSITCNSTDKIKDNINYITKVQDSNHPAMKNEEKIGKIIQEKIKNYENYFAPIHDVCQVDLTGLDEKNECKIIQEKENVMSYRIKYLGKNTIETQFKIWHKQLNERDYFLRVIDLIIYVLYSLNKLLIESNIIHNDTKCDNILFYRKNQSPIIIDFGLSIFIPELNKKEEFRNYNKAIFWLYGFEYMLLNKINTYPTDEIEVVILMDYLNEFIEINDFNYFVKFIIPEIKNGYTNQIKSWTKGQERISRKELFNIILDSTKGTWDLYSFMTSLIENINNILLKNEKHKETIQEITEFCLETIIEISNGSTNILSTIEKFNNLLKKKAEIEIESRFSKKSKSL